MAVQSARDRIHVAEDQYVQVGQIRTRFWQVGQEGSPVVLIQGVGAFVESWHPNVLPLAEQHRVYALDLPGQGRSDRSKGPYTIPYFARFVKDFLETQHVERASLIGASMGGAVALQFAETFPEKVEKLVLAAPIGLGGEGGLGLRLLALPLIPELLLRPSRRASALTARGWFYDRTLIADDLIDAHYELTKVPGAHAAALAMWRGMVSSLGGVRPEFWRPIVDNLGRITAPTLVVWGKQDPLVPVAHARVAEERIPDVRVHVFDRCGPVSNVECAAEFNKLALEFLAS